MAENKIMESIRKTLKLQEQKYTWKKLIIGQHALADQNGNVIIFRSKVKAGNAAHAAGARTGKFIRDTGYTKKGKPYSGFAVYVKEPPSGS